MLQQHRNKQDRERSLEPSDTCRPNRCAACRQITARTFFLMAPCYMKCSPGDLHSSVRPLPIRCRRSYVTIHLSFWKVAKTFHPLWIESFAIVWRKIRSDDLDLL